MALPFKFPGFLHSTYLSCSAGMQLLTLLGGVKCSHQASSSPETEQKTLLFITDLSSVNHWPCRVLSYTPCLTAAVKGFPGILLDVQETLHLHFVLRPRTKV